MFFCIINGIHSLAAGLRTNLRAEIKPFPREVAFTLGKGRKTRIIPEIDHFFFSPVELLIFQYARHRAEVRKKRVTSL